MESQAGRAIPGRGFVEAMTLPVRQASAAARWLEGRVPNRPKAEEATPEKAALTDADCVAQEILLVGLRACFPQVSIDVEEDTPTAREFPRGEGGPLVVIDPIDGTLRYLRRDGPYAIVVGLEIAGAVVASVVGLPGTDTVIRAVRGEGAEVAVGGAPFRPARASPRGRTLFVSHGLPDEMRDRLEHRGHKILTAAGGAIGVAPLLDDVAAGLRISTGPDGLSRRAWVARLPCLEAGGVVEGLDGAFPERYRPGVPGLIAGASGRCVASLREVLR